MAHRLAIVGAEHPLADRVARALGLVGPVPAEAVASYGIIVSLERSADDVRRITDALAGTAQCKVVHLSSVTVYGARASDPVPMSEEHPLQPAHEYKAAVEHAESERLLATFARRHTGVLLTVLRSAVSAGDPLLYPIARGRIGVRKLAPPRQFVHPDDVVGALAWAAEDDHPGVYNLAPEGWLEDALVARIAGRHRRVELPLDATRRMLKRLELFGATRVPPGALPYIAYPMLVDTSRLAAAGFRCARSNEDALLACLSATPAPGIPKAVPAAAGLAGIAVAGWAWSKSRAKKS